MPADTSKAAAVAAAARRRNNLRRDAEDVKYDSSHAREIELKRSRGEISCAECRRCDHRTLPLIMNVVLTSTPSVAPGSRCNSVHSSSSSATVVLKVWQIRCDKTIPCQSCQVRSPQARLIQALYSSPPARAAPRMCCTMSEWFVAIDAFRRASSELTSL